MNPRTLYELTGADANLRFSPYCWRSRMALLHKELNFDTHPWRFTDKAAIAFSGQGRVPVLVDGETTVFDSWTIAEHLESTYPAAPSLFGGASGLALTRFINTFVDTVVNPGIAMLIVSDIYHVLAAQDQTYFRESREKLFGKSLEEVTANRAIDVKKFRQSLEPIRRVLAKQVFLGGAAPLYADYIVFGSFQWARCTSTFELLSEEDSILLDWRNRCLALFDGHAGKALHV